MKRSIKIILVFSILAGTLSLVYVAKQAPLTSCAWQLSFGEDFNGVVLDTTKWNTQYPSGNGGEQQFYAPDAFTLQDGILKITAEKRSMQGYPFTSGIITTQGTFSQKYGYFTIRAKLPKGQGFWPAFWLLPVQPDYPTEIDVFEMLGGDPSTIYMANHWMGANQDSQVNVIPYQGPDFSSDFHTFSILWDQTGLTWYVDGVEQARTSVGVPDMPMFLLANLAVGGEWPGYPDRSTLFPSSMEIDYIYAYQYKCNPGWNKLTNRLEFFTHEFTIGSTTPGKYHYK